MREEMVEAKNHNLKTFTRTAIVTVLLKRILCIIVHKTNLNEKLKRLFIPKKWQQWTNTKTSTQLLTELVASRNISRFLETEKGGKETRKLIVDSVSVITEDVIKMTEVDPLFNKCGSKVKVKACRDYGNGLNGYLLRSVRTGQIFSTIS